MARVKVGSRFAALTGPTSLWFACAGFSIYQTTSSSRSGIHPSFGFVRNRKRTVWRSGGIVRSQAPRPNFQNRPSASPWPRVRYNQTCVSRSRRSRPRGVTPGGIAQMCVGNRGTRIVVARDLVRSAEPYLGSVSGLSAMKGGCSQPMLDLNGREGLLIHRLVRRFSTSSMNCLTTRSPGLTGPPCAVFVASCSTRRPIAWRPRSPRPSYSSSIATRRSSSASNRRTFSTM